MRGIVIGFGGLILVWLGSALLPVHFDEAQYATWLAFPDFSYQTKGPWVTFTQSLTHTLSWLPQTVQVRLPAWIAWLASAAALLWLGHLAGLDRRQSRLLLLLFVTSPLVLTLGSVHTTDIWLLCFILVAYGAMASVLSAPPRSHPELWWMVMGVALGLGALSKLSIALIPLSILPWVLLRSPHLLLTPGPYLGALFCALCFSPWIAWNLDNDFSHFKHEFGHVGSEGSNPMHAVNWIPGFLLAAMPLFAWLLLGGLRLKPKAASFDDDASARVREMLLASFVTLAAFFVVKGLFGEVLLNWALPLLPVLLILWAERFKGSLQTAAVLGVLQVAILLLLLFPYSLGLSKDRDAFQKIRGWDRAMADAAVLAGPTEVLSAGHYSTLAWALYFWPSEAADAARYGAPLGQVVPETTRRLNQYDHWGVLNSPHARVVHLGGYSEAMAARCGSFTLLGTVSQIMPDDTVRSTLDVYECLDFVPDPVWPAIVRY